MPLQTGHGGGPRGRVCGATAEAQFSQHTLVLGEPSASLHSASDFLDFYQYINISIYDYSRTIERCDVKLHVKLARL